MTVQIAFVVGVMAGAVLALFIGAVVDWLTERRPDPPVVRSFECAHCGAIVSVAGDNADRVVACGICGKYPAPF